MSFAAPLMPFDKLYTGMCFRLLLPEFDNDKNDSKQSSPRHTSNVNDGDLNTKDANRDTDHELDFHINYKKGNISKI